MNEKRGRGWRIKNKLQDTLMPDLMSDHLWLILLPFANSLHAYSYI